MPASPIPNRKLLIQRPTVWQYLRGYRQLQKIRADLEANPSKFDALKAAPAPVSLRGMFGLRRPQGPRRAQVPVGPGRCAQKGHRPPPQTWSLVSGDIVESCSRCMPGWDRQYPTWDPVPASEPVS